MSYTHLTMDERNVIFVMKIQGYRQAEIARWQYPGTSITVVKGPSPQGFSFLCFFLP